VKIQDAKPGDVLRDKDGALWLRGKKNARVLDDPTENSSGDSTFEADPVTLDHCEQFGPFVRLVPEEESQW